MRMESTETEKSSKKNTSESNKELLPFVPRQNPRITEDDQLRFEKKIRVYFHSASMKVRGKQWDLALADIERAMRIANDIGWKEAAARAKLMRDVVEMKR